MDEDVKRVLALEDRLFEMTLKRHLLSGHQAYLYECDHYECAQNRTLLGDDIFMLKYGQQSDALESAKVESSNSDVLPIT